MGQRPSPILVVEPLRCPARGEGKAKATAPPAQVAINERRAVSCRDLKLGGADRALSPGGRGQRGNFNNHRRVRGAAAILSQAATPPHLNALPASGEREENQVASLGLRPYFAHILLTRAASLPPAMRPTTAE